MAVLFIEIPFMCVILQSYEYFSYIMRNHIVLSCCTITLLDLGSVYILTAVVFL